MSTPIYRDIVNAAEQVGLSPKYVATTRGGEHHSACPECGGKDRFILHPNYEGTNCKGSFFCRQCGIKGDFIEFCRKYCGCNSFEEAVELANGRMPANFTKNNSNRSRKITAAPPVKTIAPQPMRTITSVSPMWQEQAERLMHTAHNNLLQNSEQLEWLERRGLPHGAVERYKFGWLPENRRDAGSLWGLQKEEVFIPAGLLIPTLGKDGKPRRLKSRCKDWKLESSMAKYIAIPGSMEGLNLIGDTYHKVVIAAESEFDAYAIHYSIGDIACVIAVGGNNKKPDGACAHIAKSATQLFICHDNDEAGIAMLRRWREVNSAAIAYPTPIGKDIGEAVALGLNIRNFFLAAITPSIEQTEAIQPIEITAPTVLPSKPEVSATQQEECADEAANNAPLPEAQIVPVHDEEYVTRVSESTHEDKPLLTPLNDFTMLVNWATAYFNGIPYANSLPSDRCLRTAVNTLENKIVSEALQKELRWAYRLATGNIL